MNKFVKGILVGVGIGLFVAPVSGKEMRNRLKERFQEMRGYLPENEQMSQYVRQVSKRVSQTGSDLKDYAQQAVSKVKETGGDLGELAQQATSTVKQTSQDVVGTTKQAVTSAKQSGESSTSSSYGDYNGQKTL
jgi:gas vesicle protein